MKETLPSLNSFQSLATIDGIIHYKLFRPLLSKLSKSNNHKTGNVIEISKLWDECIDIDKNGDISLEEWIAMFKTLNTEISESKRWFEIIAKDNKEFINKVEFVLYLMDVGDQDALELQQRLMSIM